MISKKKLIILTYDFPPANGGIARLCREIAAGMHSYYSSVEVVTRDMTGPNTGFTPKNFIVKRFSEKRGRLELAIIKYLKSYNSSEIDILCGVWHPEASLALLAGHRNIYVLGHGTEFLYAKSLFRKHFWINTYCKFILKKIKKIIANSHYTEGLIKNIDLEARTKVIPLAVDYQFFYPEINPHANDNKLRIATLARILEFKGYDTIANAIASLSEEYKNKVEWNIGGTGPYLPELQELVKKLNIEQNVNFLGYIKDENLTEFYNNNNIFVLCTKESPSSTEVEGFGLVFLEAQSCGIPVIGTKTGGIFDAIEDGNGGWLIEQNDFLTLSKMFMEYMDNPNILILQGTNARNRVLSSCTFDIYNDKLNKILKDG